MSVSFSVDPVDGPQPTLVSVYRTTIASPLRFKLSGFFRKGKTSPP